MAHKKGVGSSRNGRDSHSQRLGLKKFGGERVLGGNILARQRGTKWKPGNNVGRGKDDTLFALIEGFVKFEDKGQRGKFISVYADRGARVGVTIRSSEASAGRPIGRSFCFALRPKPGLIRSKIRHDVSRC